MADITFAHYYQTELAYFRELGQEFGRAYPEVAYMVAGRGGDRAVERLIQGSSLLSARLRFRIEDDLPEIAHALFEQMWPQYLRPMPAVTLIQFTGLPDALRQSQRIPGGTSLKSRSVETPRGNTVECTFNTCHDVHIHPLELTRAELNQAHPADLQLRLGLRLTGGATFDNLRLRALRLHMLGDEVTRYTLFRWMTHCVDRITLRDPRGDTCLTLQRGDLELNGLKGGLALFPHVPTPLPGLRLLEEYFTFPDKFLCVEVGGLDRCPAERLQEELELVFHLGRTSNAEKIHVDTSCLALGCVPAINISRQEELDLTVEQDKHQYRLTAPSEGQVFDVEKVGGYDLETSQWIDYRHFFSEGLSRLEKHRPCYHTLRRADGVEGAEVYLTITDTAGLPVTPPTDQLHVVISYTDGTVAHLLREGDVHIPSTDTPEFVTFANITPVRQGEPVGLDRDRHWQLLSQFAIHPHDLYSKDGLQQLLNETGANRPGARVPEIRSLRSDVDQRLFKQTIMPVREIDISLGEEAFLCEGQLCLFAGILGGLLSRPSSSNVFHRVRVRTPGSNEEYLLES